MAMKDEFFETYWDTKVKTDLTGILRSLPKKLIDVLKQAEGEVYCLGWESAIKFTEGAINSQDEVFEEHWKKKIGGASEEVVKEFSKSMMDFIKKQERSTFDLGWDTAMRFTTGAFNLSITGNC